MTDATQIKRALIRHPGLSRLAVIAALLLLWEVAARWWIDPTFLSPPSKIVAGLGDLFNTKGIPAALQITAWELAVAFCRCSSCISASDPRRKSPSA
jgi:ABC-type nitrate/sulfonate/bicarbonate transport system permease component